MRARRSRRTVGDVTKLVGPTGRRSPTSVAGRPTASESQPLSPRIAKANECAAMTSSQYTSPAARDDPRPIRRPVRGRAGELKLIGSLIAELAQGRGGVLIVEGPPGIGKSRLLAESRALAEKSGIRTLFG